MVYTVQVKRLRHQDPLDTLIVRGSKRKRSDDDHCEDIVFKLADTQQIQPEDSKVYFKAPNEPQSGSEELILSLETGKKQRKLNPPQSESLPPELQSMMDEYIQAEKIESLLSITNSSDDLEEDFDKETESYVYDIYYSDAAGTYDSNNSRTGCINLNEENWNLLFPATQDEEEAESMFDLHGDEDSNAEDYYKNEYPENDTENDTGCESLFKSESDFETDYVTEDAPSLYDYASDGDEFTTANYGWD